MQERERKMLSALLRNGRIPLSKLARLAGFSRENCDYRLKKLQEDGVVLQFSTTLNHAALGFSHFVVFVEYGFIDPGKEAEILKKITSDPYVSWLGTASGRWSVVFDVYAKDFDDLNAVLARLAASFSDYCVLHVQKARYFFEKLIGEPAQVPAAQSSRIHLDETDKDLLRMLCENCRVSYAELSRSIGLTANAIKWRIKRMSAAGLLHHTVVIDHRALGYEWHGVQVKVAPGQEPNPLESFLESHPHVSFYYAYSKSGQHDYDIGFLARSSQDLREFLNTLRGTFPHLKITDTFLVLDQMTAHGFCKGLISPSTSTAS